jgi:hypothetical protein
MGWWSFDDKKVKAYIDDALAQKRAYWPRAKQNQEAWLALYALRQQTDPNDDNRELAAAEHYMYARYQVSSGETDEYVMKALTVGWDYGKALVDTNPPILIMRKISGISWTRPSTDSIRWGWRGCHDGAIDKQLDQSPRGPMPGLDAPI